MNENDKSPIIERLCKFIEISGLSNSQFADKAGIPRPSLSQMLHGRNKSLNNQVLAKLNEAFPQLNIVWLLFGQGNMLKDSNFEFSEPQNPQSDESKPSQLFDYPDNTTAQPETEPSLFANQNSSQRQQTPPHPASAPQMPPSFAEIITKQVADKEPAKKIASIIVLFTDNSFETFVPSKD